MKAAQIDGLEGLKALIDQEVTVSDWQIVSQEQVQAFADTTGDQQWIHTDPERARREAPFGGTIAHGFLGLSLLPRMLEQQLQRAVRLGLGRLLERRATEHGHGAVVSGTAEGSFLDRVHPHVPL